MNQCGYVDCYIDGEHSHFTATGDDVAMSQLSEIADLRRQLEEARTLGLKQAEASDAYKDVLFKGKEELGRQVEERDVRIAPSDEYRLNADELKRIVNGSIPGSALSGAVKDLLLAHYQIAALTEALKEAGRDSLPCGICHLPIVFEFTVASSIWNRIVRAKGLNEYLCFWCFDRLAVESGEHDISIGVNISGLAAHSNWSGDDVPGAYPDEVTKAQLLESLKERDALLADIDRFALHAGLAEQINWLAARNAARKESK